MIDLFANMTALQHSLDYHLARHGLLSSNIANAETPGFRPLDLSFQAYLSRADEMRVTDSKHLPGGADGGYRMAVFEDPSGSPGNDGNGVSTEREMAKLAANSLRYRAAAEMLSRRLALLRYAANDGQRR